MREWMATIPGEIKKHKETIDKAMDDYQLIEEFFYNLSQDDFNAKYTALFWPNKIEEQVAQTELNLEADEERFRKLQQSDQAAFQEKIDSLQVNWYPGCRLETKTLFCFPSHQQNFLG